MRTAVLALAVAGCAPAVEPVAPAVPPTVAARCDAAAVQALVGRTFTAGLGTQAQAAAGAAMLRVIRPGTMVARDFRVERLNLHLDANDAIERATCG